MTKVKDLNQSPITVRIRLDQKAQKSYTKLQSPSFQRLVGSDLKVLKKHKIKEVS